MARRVPPAPVVAALLAARRGLGRVQRAMVPPEVVLFERTLGIADTKAVAVAAELGLADHLASGPLLVRDLAARSGADPDALGRLMRYLSGRGIFRCDRRGRVANNRVSRLLRRHTDASLHGWARFFGSRWHVAAWNHLDHAVATGSSAFADALGSSFWDHLRDHDDVRRVFADAMAAASRIQADLVAKAHDFSRCRTVCDVGGGTGTVLARILSAHPHLDGVLFDLPEVVADAGPVLDDAGAAERVRLVGGDFFAAVPAGCDRYVLQAVVHDWSDDDATRILERVHAACGPDSRVLVLEQPRPTRPGDHLTHAFDLEMLVDTGAGRERTVAEYGALFDRAGLRLERVVPVAVSTIFELAPRE